MQYPPKWENKTLLHIMMTGIPCVKTFLTNFYQHFKSLMVELGLVGIIAEPLKYQNWNNNLFCRARCWRRNQLYLQLHNSLLGSALVAGLSLNISFYSPKAVFEKSFEKLLFWLCPGPASVPSQHWVCGSYNQFRRLPTLHNIRHWAPAWE